MDEDDFKTALVQAIEEGYEELEEVKVLGKGIKVTLLDGGVFFVPNPISLNEYESDDSESDESDEYMDINDQDEM